MLWGAYTDSDEYGLVRDCLEPSGNIHGRRRQFVPDTGDSQQTHTVNEPPRTFNDSWQTLVGRCRSSQQHGFDASIIGSAGPRASLFERQVRKDGCGHASLFKILGKANITSPERNVVVGHHCQRNLEIGAAHSGQNRMWCAASGQRTVIGFLDNGAIHDRIREWDTDLYAISTSFGDGVERFDPVVPKTTGDVRNENLAAIVTTLSQRCFECSNWCFVTHLPNTSIICATSLSPRPLKFMSTVLPASSSRARLIQAKACAHSRAGMIPSVRDKS